MNYYEKHVGDWIKDTVSLDMTEDGAYNRLIDQYYQSERPLPLDLKEIYRLARANKPAERKAVDYVLGKFFERTADGYTQKRVQAEIARYQDKQDKARRSADARWSAHKKPSEGNANASAKAMRTHSERTAKAMLSSPQSPIPIQRERAGARASPVDNSSDGHPTHTAAVPAMGEEDRQLLAVIRADLIPIADIVWRKFCEHKPPRQRTQTTWRQWVLDERPPGEPARNGHHPPPAATDPNSRASVEAAGIQLGIGPWNELSEQWTTYRARVRHAQSPAPSPALQGVA